MAGNVDPRELWSDCGIRAGAVGLLSYSGIGGETVELISDSGIRSGTVELWSDSGIRAKIVEPWSDSGIKAVVTRVWLLLYFLRQEGWTCGLMVSIAFGNRNCGNVVQLVTAAFGARTVNVI